MAAITPYSQTFQVTVVPARCDGAVRASAESTISGHAPVVTNAVAIRTSDEERRAHEARRHREQQAEHGAGAEQDPGSRRGGRARGTCTRPASVPPTFPAWTPANVRPTTTGARWNCLTRTSGTSGSIIASAETSSRSGSCIAMATGRRVGGCDAKRPPGRRAAPGATARARRACRRTDRVAELHGERLVGTRSAEHGHGQPGDRRSPRHSECVRRVVKREPPLAANGSGRAAEEHLAADPEETDAGPDERGPRPA